MALNGYKHYKEKDERARTTIDIQTYQFTVEPLFCNGCLNAIRKVLNQHGIAPVSDEVLEYGKNREGEKSGILAVTVTSDISEESIREALRDGNKLKESTGRRLGY